MKFCKEKRKIQKVPDYFAKQEQEGNKKTQCVTYISHVCNNLFLYPYVLGTNRHHVCT